VLVLTMLEDTESVLAAIRAGAKGYLVKGVDGEQTLRGIHAVAAGQSVFGDGAAQRIAAFLSAPVPPAPLPQLTSREREVLVLMAKGYTNTTIAERMYLSHKTIRNYVAAILSKLGVADRTQAVLCARDAGLT
jgi:DNA-binding NarL/FixJ family response regulator